MWEGLGEYGLFLAKVVTLVAGAGVVVGVAAVAASRRRQDEDGHIEVRKLNERFREMREALRDAALDAKELKRQRRAESKEEKRRRKTSATEVAAPGDGGHPRRIYVLEFHGDLRAHAVESLREEVTAILTYAEPQDAVLARVESGGGLVHSYGLAAAQLARIRDRGIPLTVCVDKVAASGGYMMACVANRIVAAPFAILGSIGVVAQIPNFNRLLRKHDIDYELLTAGPHKRTLTLFGQNTDAGRRKFTEELEDTHALFRDFVARYRPALDMAAVATGEAWYGERALSQGLVDALGTSDEELQRAAEHAEILEVRYVRHTPLARRIGAALEGAVERGVSAALDRLSAPDDWKR